MSDTNSFINDLVDDFNKVQELILPDEPTVAQSISVHLTKVLILTCASHYEQVLQNAYTSYAERQSAVYDARNIINTLVSILSLVIP